MLQSTNGLVLGNGQWMNANKLEHYLAWLDNCDKDKVKRLLYPDDPQDVPQVVLCKAQPQAPGQAEPGFLKLGQAGPHGWLITAFGPASELSRP